jgi:amidase
VAAALRRAEELGSTINALVELRPEEALTEARRADERASSEGADKPLDGVPISVKDHFDVAGMKHTEGVRALADRRSQRDAVAVARLRSAGAIVIGKGNQPDYEIRWNTLNELYGQTKNPRDLGKTAGGSSGGDAAAVAAGIVPIGLGADYGGSIRVPSTFCEIVGVRPSAGTVPAVQATEPLDGPPTLDYMNSTGPMARSLADLELALGVLRGPHPGDPATVDATPKPAGTSPRKLAAMLDETGATVTPAVEEQLNRTAETLSAGGYEVVRAGIPRARRAPELWGELVGTELLHSALPTWGDTISESSRQHIETMFGLWDLGSDVERFIASFMERRACAREVAEWMEDYPLILAPVAGMETPPAEFDIWLSEDDTRVLFDTMRDVMWVNLLGLPSIALPNGMQIVARKFHEPDAFAAAGVVMEAVGPVAGADSSKYGREPAARSSSAAR